MYAHQDARMVGHYLAEIISKQDHLSKNGIQLMLKLENLNAFISFLNLIKLTMEEQLEMIKLYKVFNKEKKKVSEILILKLSIKQLAQIQFNFHHSWNNRHLVAINNLGHEKKRSKNVQPSTNAHHR